MDGSMDGWMVCDRQALYSMKGGGWIYGSCAIDLQVVFGMRTLIDVSMEHLQYAKAALGRE